MATVYIKPGTGTGTGTASDPYFYSQLSSAETAAGNGGTILFTDGTYTFSGNQTWDAATLADMTYKSENDGGAYLLGETSIRRLTMGSSSTSTMKIEGFKAANIHYQGVSATTYTINKITHADTFSGSRGGAGILYLNSATNLNIIKNSSFVIDYSTSDRLFHTTLATTITSCSFFLKCSAVASGGITSYSGPYDTAKNTIFMSDNSSAIADNAITAADCTNCCIYQMHSNDGSGGTNNVFDDPQFVDAPSGDLRLRPSSPCINAGTSS